MENLATEGQCIPWYCANVKTGREQVVAAALTALEIETYLPLEIYSSWRNVTRWNPIQRAYNEVPERQERTRAWFPSYFFARLDDRGWSIVKTKLRRTLGASLIPRWVDLGTGAPIAVDESDMVTIMSLIGTPPARFGYKKGDAVQVISGPLQGLTGLFSRNKAERIWVLMRLMGGKEQEHEFNLNAVRPINMALTAST